MRRMLTLILLTASSMVFSDEIEQGIFAKCSEGYKIEVGSYNTINGAVSPSSMSMFPYLPKSDLNLIYKDYKEHELSCNIAGKTINVKFRIEEPSPRGACGAVPGGKLTLEIDGVSIIGNATINNECYQSIEKISISSYDSKEENIKYQFCGNGNTSNLSVSGCVELNNDNFSILKLPLSSFPISKLLQQANTF